VLQIGAREHYAVARALQRQGQLHELLTDCWVPPRSALARLPQARRLVGRYHPDLATARVMAPSLRSLAFELRGRLPGAARGWPRTMARNAWFQRWACRRLGTARQPPRALFAYSYAAGSLLALAREWGWAGVLGQIDPGPEEERIVAAEHRRYPTLPSRWRPAPAAYWRDWHREVSLADRIVVNSEWSRQCLVKEGVPEEKLSVVPLVFSETGIAGAEDVKVGQRGVSPPVRPFELLFLGTVCLRKGIGRLLEAMRLLEGRPLRLTLAGPSELDDVFLCDRPNIRWLGAVPRSAVGLLYQAADVMILPTLSDGFALTQLEALAHGCPLIASRHCGEVVMEGQNGWLLPDLEPPTLAATILRAAEQACHLPRPLPAPAFGLAELSAALLSLPCPTA
jgi:glycosyltransferase involved in cell wall biosynthesis